MTEPAAEWELFQTLTDAEEWRRDQLRKAGFAYLDALELAVNPKVDLHVACDLVASGCAPETALQILS